LRVDLIHGRDWLGSIGDFKMKYLILVLVMIISTGCSSIVKKEPPEQLVKIGENRYQVVSIADYARENGCYEGYRRGKFYCKGGRTFRAVHR